jgi:hypothetical protein
MSARVAGTAAAGVALALALTQDVLPGAAFYHRWQYALLLAAALAVVVASIVSALRSGSRWAALALGGALLAGLAGLASGLLGPDTASVIGTPGTVAPIPALGAAAFFGAADAAAIGRGDATIVLRRPGKPALEVAAFGHRLDGESILGLEARPAAFVEAWDEHGAHLTITQPSNASFLSPVLLFRQRQKIGEFDVPFDVFATPGRGRIFHALFFTPRDLANFPHAVADTAHPALILTVSDEAGKPLGIALAPSAKTIELGGVRVRATLGTFPALTIASAPPAWALAGGLALSALGLAGGALSARRRAGAAIQPAGT